MALCNCKDSGNTYDIKKEIDSLRLIGGGHTYLLILQCSKCRNYLCFPKNNYDLAMMAGTKETIHQLNNLKELMGEFEQYVLKRHPDVDSMTMIDQFNLRPNEEVRVGLEWRQITQLAEEYARDKANPHAHPRGLRFNGNLLSQEVIKFRMTRSAGKMTMKEFARQVNIGDSTIGRVERNEDPNYTPDIEVLVKICNFIKLDMNKLFF